MPYAEPLAGGIEEGDGRPSIRFDQEPSRFESGGRGVAWCCVAVSCCCSSAGGLSLGARW